MSKVFKACLSASLLALAVGLSILAAVPGSLVVSSPAAVPPDLACQRDTLKVLAMALEAQAASLNPEPSLRLADGLEKTAAVLEQQAQAARQAAQDLEDTGEALLVWAEVCRELLHLAHLDLELAGKLHTSLTTFSDGSQALEKLLEMPQLPAVRQGLQGFDSALTNAAADFEELASVTYPRFYWNGKWPAYEWVPVLPNGYQAAEGMRQAAEGLRSAEQELKNLGEQLPRIRRAVASSREILNQVRDACGVIYENRHEIGRHQERLADLIQFVAENLALTTGSLAHMMRQVEQSESLAHELRETEKLLRESAENTQAVRDRLNETSRAARDQAEALAERIENAATPPAASGGQAHWWSSWLTRGLLALAAVTCFLLGLRELTVFLPRFSVDSLGRGR
ncbi:MAG: hypothetical protein NZM31_09545 [Gemmatales bacterium]|nr:hypothetical protein [Gemmatales bacterium]MDW8387237.1 hypothetical protein [Gemmatales bacterium]